MIFTLVPGDIGGRKESVDETRKMMSCLIRRGTTTRVATGYTHTHAHAVGGSMDCWAFVHCWKAEKHFTAHIPIPMPTTMRPTSRASFPSAAPITTDPTANTTLAARMTGLRPNRSIKKAKLRKRRVGVNEQLAYVLVPDRNPPMREKTQAAAMVPETMASCQPLLNSISFLKGEFNTLLPPVKVQYICSCWTW